MGRQPTQEDVARAAGVSRGLVSLALSGTGSVAPATRERILSAAKQLGYTRNFGAATLAARRSPVVGVCLPSLRNPFFESVVSPLQRRVEDAGLQPLITTSDNSPDRELASLRRFIELRAAGVFMISPVGELAALADCGAQIPLVLIGAVMSAPHVPSVHIDEDAAAALVAAHARERGWTRIVAVSQTSPTLDRWVRHRQDALRSAGAAAGIGVDVLALDDGAGLGDALAPFVRHSKADRPLVVAHNSLVAINIVAALRAVGIEPGQSVGLVSYDDTYLLAHPSFDITALSQNVDELAACAMDLLQQMGQADDTAAFGAEQLITPSLHARSTS
ncbi:MAG: LacI family DNA-binding transcriptional regulator [Actinomycetaceae bacterium]|nr:LacI family DNA-binding transcriptional regulator [Actinomycetaceae bacterium]MDU0970190.1 LacI family DNA-binding transcriptional regulator [Actinomycetaceae bacterium]